MWQREIKCDGKSYIGVPSHIPSVQRGQDKWHTLRGDLPANIGQLEILQVQKCKI